LHRPKKKPRYKSPRRAHTPLESSKTLGNETNMSDSVDAPLSLPPGLRSALEQKAKDKNTSLQALLEAAVTW
jgi:hypothetical protein